MPINLDEALKVSFKMLEDYSDYLDFMKYCRSYLFSTEQIKRYLEEVTFHHSRALTVLSSGDHVFDLVYRGVYNIDAFDLNQLAYFWYWFKYAAIKGLTFEEFQRANDERWYFYNINHFALLIEKIKDFMPDPVYIYFKTLIQYLSKKQHLDGLTALVRRSQFRKDNSYYLSSNEKYVSLQNALDNLQLTFFFGDANQEIPKMVKGDYDIILLSNISDFLGLEKEIGIEEFREYLKKYYQLLNPEGILINYLFYCDEEFVINNSHITKDSLEDYIHSFQDGEGYFLARKPKNGSKVIV